MKKDMPELDRIRSKFLALLPQRREMIVKHLQASLPDRSRLELTAAQDGLHQIAGLAGSVGLLELGQAARTSEDHIMLYLDGDAPWSDGFEETLMDNLKAFETASDAALAQ